MIRVFLNGVRVVEGEDYAWENGRLRFKIPRRRPPKLSWLVRFVRWIWEVWDGSPPVEDRITIESGHPYTRERLWLSPDEVLWAPEDEDDG